MTEQAGSASTPAGWYPDPAQPGQQRYWDGTTWTEHRAPGQVAAPPYSPGTAPAQPQPKKGKGCLIAFLVGIGVLILIAIVVAVAAAGGSKNVNSSSNGESSGTSMADDSATNGSQAAGLNTPVRDGKFEFTVKSVKCGVTRVGDQFLHQNAQGQFCLVKMTVKNIGDEAQTFDASNQKGLSSTGVTFDADGGASLYVNEDAEGFLTSINPGNQVTGVVVFDIPKSAKLSSLELHDSAFSDGVTVAVG